MTDFDRALRATLVYEGGYVWNKNDPGGETQRGVTAAVYNAYRDALGKPRRSVYYISDTELREIYKTGYWDKVTQGRTWPLNAVLFDVAVNSGPAVALWLLEQAKREIAQTDPQRMLHLALRLCDKWEQFFRRIVERRPASAEFLRGWLRRCNEQRQLCLAGRALGLLDDLTLPIPNPSDFTPKTPEDFDPEAT